MIKRRLVSEGHLIDSGVLNKILNLIIDEKGDYEIIDFKIGKTSSDPSYMEVDIKSEENNTLNSIVSKLVNLGCFEKKVLEAVFKPAPKDKSVPDEFYSTTNYRSMVFINEKWHEVKKQRMDAVIVNEGNEFICKKIRDIKKGDSILCSTESVRVFPPYKDRSSDDFGFMQNDVSSERSVDISTSMLATEIKRMVAAKEKIVVVAGPVVIHTGGAPSLAELIKRGYVHGLLGGNAVAVHDIENAYYGTSLGIDLKTGIPVEQGNKNHMRAINRINFHGSIKNAVENNDLKSGIMYEVIKSKIPFALAGSLRDDGPLPETITDMIEAQAAYSEIIKDASMVIMLSSMLHSIATGNMMPAWIKTICIDINPSVVTKLADRGSGQAIGIVTDVGLFLRSILEKLS
jgi:lysine-ketoglutarate reductase/saccharopine dehydrogenase-like protein (TIGR00300 family)